jgi:hypothetical protein
MSNPWLEAIPQGISEKFRRNGFRLYSIPQSALRYPAASELIEATLVLATKMASLGRLKGIGHSIRAVMSYLVATTG